MKWGYESEVHKIRTLADLGIAPKGSDWAHALRPRVATARLRLRYALTSLRFI